MKSKLSYFTTVAIMFLFSLFTINSCTKHDNAPPPEVSSSTTTTVAPIPAGSVPSEQPQVVLAPLDWENKRTDPDHKKWEQQYPDRSGWSQELKKQMLLALPSFNEATDKLQWCPNYAKLSQDQQAYVWAVMAVKLTTYESDYSPTSSYKENNGKWSLGLFQLSYEDVMPWCEMSKSRQTLYNPIMNIQCAVPKMAKLILHDKVIASGHYGNAKGMAQYWSAIMDAGYSRGHQEAIKQTVASLPICKI